MQLYSNTSLFDLFKRIFNFIKVPEAQQQDKTNKKLF